MKKYLFVLLTCLIPGIFLAESKIDIVPFPAKIEAGNSFFSLSSHTQLVVENNVLFFNEVNHFQTYLKTVLGDYLSDKDGVNKILIKQGNLSGEVNSYTLDITSEQITIVAQSQEGLFYAFQTLKQLIFSNQDKAEVILPTLAIYDYPSYEWRGMMLDISRHFFSIAFLKKQIDLLAYYKFNKLHLHLTDDQGWRLEIKQYPELTRQSAWRTFNRQDSSCIKQSDVNPDMALDSRFLINHAGETLYGGYYTQDEIKGLVQYAKERHIEIIPEIDMPGHMMAAISAYPELSCTGEAAWGDVFSIPLCPCNENVYTFLENILDEVVELFPSKYIHIGADEVEKDTWKSSQVCKDLMHERGLQSVEQLQSYFVERIKNYLAGKDREIIAWDEVLEGGIGPEVNIMYWRDWIGGVPEKAFQNGNRIIFTPGYPLYVSRQDSSLYDIYHLKVFKNIPADKKAQVWGAQANMWAERIPTENRANYLLYPRLLALAEINWTPQEQQDWESFKRRLENQKEYLTGKGVKHMSAPSSLIPLMQTDTVNKVLLFDFESEKVNPEIYYTLDGTVPTKKSKRYEGTISVSKSAQVCAGIFEDGNIQQPLFRRSADYHKAIGKPVKYISFWHPSYPASGESALTDGYRGGERYNDGFWQGFNTNMEVIIDLEKVEKVSCFAATFMQLTGPGVYMPEYVKVSISTDGQQYEKVLLIPNDVSEEEKELIFKTFSGNLKNKKARYIKVFASNKSTDRFIFADEIVIN